MLITIVVMMAICAAAAFNPGTLMRCASHLLPRFMFFVETIIIAVTAMSPHHIAVANPRGIDVGGYLVNSDAALTNSRLGTILVPKYDHSSQTRGFASEYINSGGPLERYPGLEESTTAAVGYR